MNNTNEETAISSVEDVYVLSDQTRKTSSGNYLGIGLPDEIQQFGLTKGDYVELELNTDEYNGNEFKYIKGIKSDSKNGRKIQHGTESNPTLKIGIPIRWTDSNNDSENFSLDQTAGVNVQMTTDNELEIYRYEDFLAIHAQEPDTDSIGDGERTELNPAAESGRWYEKQKFRITPFNSYGINPSFKHKPEPKNELPDVIGSPQLFERLKKEEKVTRYSPRYASLDIYWDEQAKSASVLQNWKSNPEKLESKKIESITTHSRSRLRRERDGAQVPPFSWIDFTLPKKGVYYFRYYTQEGETKLSTAVGGTWAAFVGDKNPLEHNFYAKGQIIDDNWVGMYFEKKDDTIEIFVPVHHNAPTQDILIKWMWDNDGTQAPP